MTDVIDDADLTAADIAWDLEGLLPDGQSPDDLLDQADAIADELVGYRGKVATLDAGELATVMHKLAGMSELASRAGHYVMLRYSENTNDPERGAAIAATQERATAIGTKLIFVDLEWAAADPEHAEAVEADPRLDFCSHHLALLRQNQKHLLTESEETIMTEKSVTGASAWVRLFSELFL